MITELGLIWAMSENGVIGRDGTLPWSLPADLARFQQITKGTTVFMGRRTWESLPTRPLPERANIVVSRRHDLEAPGATVVHSVGAALAEAPTEQVWCIGGAGLFLRALPFARRLEMTLVHAEIEGDTYMPVIDWDQWELTSETRHPADERHAHAFTFRSYLRRDRVPLEAAS